MENRIGLCAAALALGMLCACNISSDGWSDEAAIPQIAEMLGNRAMPNPIGPPPSCATDFDIQVEEIVDRRIVGEEAQVRARVRITYFGSRTAMRTSNLDGCYDDVVGSHEWRTGDEHEGIGEFRFTRWESGWRVEQSGFTGN